MKQSKQPTNKLTVHRPEEEFFWDEVRFISYLQIQIILASKQTKNFKNIVPKYNVPIVLSNFRLTI